MTHSCTRAWRRVGSALLAEGPAGWLALLALTVVTRLSGLFVPLYSNDEATYSALATRILAGAAPYSGAVDHKPAGVMLLYAAIFVLTHRNSLVAVRLVWMAIVASTGLLVAGTAGRLYGTRRARWAGALYVVVSVCGLASDLQAANTELLLNLPLGAAAYVVVRDRRHDWLIAGVLTGVAGLFKYQASLAGLAWLVLAWQSPTARARRIVHLALGFGLVALVYLRLAAGFGWNDFLFWGWRYNFRYMAAQSTAGALKDAVLNGLFMGAWWAPLLFCIRRGAPRAAWVWLGAGLLMTTPGGRFFPHYFLMALPALAVLGTSGLFTLGRPRVVAALGTGLVVLAMGLGWTWYSVRPGLSRHIAAYHAIGGYLDAHSQPADPVFVWGNSPLYFYADRPMASRFAFCNYLTGKIWGTHFNDPDADTGSQVVPEAWTALLSDLRQAPPLYLVDTAAASLDGYEHHPFLQRPELRAFVNSHYRVEASVAGATIWRRDDEMLVERR